MKTTPIAPQCGPLRTKGGIYPIGEKARPELQTLIYVIDDDETARALAEGLLADGEFRVRTFADARSALDAMNCDAPDAVVVDLLMPGMDGFEFCSRMRSQPRWSDVPVLIATALDDSKALNRAFDVGATCFMVKPINWDVEKYRLRHLLRATEGAQRLRLKEMETRQAKEEWERTFNSFTDVVTVVGLDLKVIRCNTAAIQMLGRPAEQVLGQPCHRVFQNSETPCPNCEVLRAISTGMAQSAEKSSALRPDRIFRVDSSPVCDSQGRIVSVVKVARDITEQKNLEAQCRQAQKMEAIGTLSGGVAHEFNNLLQIIMGYAGALARAAGPAGEVATMHQLIVDAAMRGGVLTRQLLAFSRKGLVQNVRWPLDLNPLVQESEEMLCRLLPKSVTIRTQLAPELGQTSADRGQLQQVLINIALNAAHAMPQGGTLSIETRNATVDEEFCRFHSELKAGDYVEMIISDTGHGMDQKTLDRIYEPFFTTKKAGDGTGLGLTVVFGIVRQHGGTILCSSQPGHGTAFRIYLPLYIPSADAPERCAPVKSKVGAGSEMIMVIDDEQPIRLMIAAALEERGYRVLTVPDGGTAVDTYREARVRPDLVLLDLGMPGVSGWDCLKQLRAIDPNVKVLLATGYGGEEALRTARQDGAMGIVNKPFQISDLEAQIRQVFDA